MTLAHLALVLSTALVGSDPTIKPSRGEKTLSPFQRSISGLDRPSERTMETFKRYDLERWYAKDPSYAIASLEKIARTRPDAEAVYALAEVCWIEGKRLDRRRKTAAIDRFVDAVAYSYDYLFEADLAEGRQPSDPRFRLACEIYNGGLTRLIRAAQLKGQITPDGTITLEVHGKKQVLRIVMRNTPWKPADLDQILLSADFEVGGLMARSYTYGLGVPLIGIHHPEDAGKGVEKFFPPEMAFPLTAFLVPNSRLRDDTQGADEPRECTLELVDPIRVHRVGAAPAELPVEADFTTPLAYMWSRTDLNRYRWHGLFRPGSNMGRANLMLLRPYEPGKIPVVMVHGLASSPLAWIPMINELLRDPVIQDRYQFMLYMYPTGVPIPIAMAGLRETLGQAEQMYSPGGKDPSFHQMVLLGHSMGGILSHGVASHSEDKLWQLNSDRHFDEILGDPDVLKQLQRYLFFEPLPFIRRVVFLATPHRGSDLSRNAIGRISTNLIADPDQISDLLSKLIKNNPNAFDPRQFRRMPTSIETLETDSPILLQLLALKPGDGVAFHSIIGSERPGPVAGTTDGVVPYRSAHLDGVESEKTVRSDHGVQKSPEAILEVRRILLKHLALAAPPTLATPGPPPTPTSPPTLRR